MSGGGGGSAGATSWKDWCCTVIVMEAKYGAVDEEALGALLCDGVVRR